MCKDPCLRCKLKQRCIDKKLLCKALQYYFKGETVYIAHMGHPTKELYDKEFTDRSN